MPQSRYFTRSQGSVPAPGTTASSSSSSSSSTSTRPSTRSSTAASSSSLSSSYPSSSSSSYPSSSSYSYHSSTRPSAPNPVTPRRRKQTTIYTTATPSSRSGSARRSQRFLNLTSSTPRAVFTSPRHRTRRTSPRSSPSSLNRPGLRSTPVRRRSNFLCTNLTGASQRGHPLLTGPSSSSSSSSTTPRRPRSAQDPPQTSLLDMAREAGDDLDMEDLNDLDEEDEDQVTNPSSSSSSSMLPSEELPRTTLPYPSSHPQPPSSPTSRPSSRFATASGVRDEMSLYAEANMLRYHDRLTSPIRRQQDLGKAGPRGGHHILSPTLRPQQETRHVLGEAGALEDLPPLDLSVGFRGDPQDVANPLATSQALHAPIPPSRPFLPFPYRILDAPKLVDDFYLNLIDWSSTNLIAVALGSMVFIWKGAYGDVSILCDVSKEDELTIGAPSVPPTGGPSSGPGGGHSLDPPLPSSSTGRLPPPQVPLTPSRRRRRPDHHSHQHPHLPHPSTTGEDSVTCVSWIRAGTHLAVGTKKGWILLYDARRGRLVQRIPAHWDRVTCLDWSGPVISSGSKDCSISHRDVRLPSSPSSRQVGEANRVDRAHGSEVCRIKWASNPAHFAPRRPPLPDAPNGHWASGGNDNIVRIWDGRMARSPLQALTHHQGAIKALGWSPHERHVLATAGGAKDRQLCIWSTATSRLLAQTSTSSQVCDLIWSPFGNELCTAQGYKDSSLRVWRYDGHQLHNMACLETSAKRVIYLTLAPDGESVLSGSPDFMLRLWKVFDARGSRRHPRYRRTGPSDPLGPEEDQGRGQQRRGILNVTTGRYPSVSSVYHVR